MVLIMWIQNRCYLYALSVLENKKQQGVTKYFYYIELNFWSKQVTIKEEKKNMTGFFLSWNCPFILETKIKRDIIRFFKLFYNCYLLTFYILLADLSNIVRGRNNHLKYNIYNQWRIQTFCFRRDFCSSGGGREKFDV